MNKNGIFQLEVGILKDNLQTNLAFGTDEDLVVGVSALVALQQAHLERGVAAALEVAGEGLSVVLSAVEGEVALVFGLEGASRLGAAELAVGRVGDQVDFERGARGEALLQRNARTISWREHKLNSRVGVCNAKENPVREHPLSAFMLRFGTEAGIVMELSKESCVNLRKGGGGG